MLVAKAILAFVIGLTVSFATQNYTSRCSWAMIAKDNNAMNRVRMACLIGQVLSVTVLFVFRGSIITLLMAGIGLLLPKNLMILKHFLVRGGLHGRRASGK